MFFLRHCAEEQSKVLFLEGRRKMQVVGREVYKRVVYTATGLTSIGRPLGRPLFFTTIKEAREEAKGLKKHSKDCVQIVIRKDGEEIEKFYSKLC